jgi:hypothetical protein
MTFNLEDALANLDPAARTIARRRIGLVHAAQRRLGMEPRNDSQLTWKYGIGELEGDVPSAIASELVVVNRLFCDTGYGAVLEEAMSAIAEHLRQKYRLSWTAVWEVTRFYAPSMLKMHFAKQLPSRETQ